MPVKIYDYYEPSFFAVEYYDLKSTLPLLIHECNCYKECGYDGIPAWLVHYLLYIYVNINNSVIYVNIFSIYVNINYSV